MNTLHLATGTIVQITLALLIAFSAAIHDYRKFQIPNKLTYSAMITGLAWHTLSPYGHGIATALGGIGVGFLSLVPFFVAGGMGGGDVKLMMAIGAVLGMPLTFFIFLASSITTGIYALYIMLTQSCFMKTLDRLKLIGYRMIVIGQHLALEDHHRTESMTTKTAGHVTVIPFGVMVAIGMTIILSMAIGAKVF